MRRLFADRVDAAEKLVAELPEVDPESAVVLALPRGGVPIGAVIAEALGIPLDVLIVRKIGAPGQRELAVGAVSGTGTLQITTNDDVAAVFGLSHEDIGRLAESERGELERRNARYRGDRPAVPLAGKTVILADDGIATGATVRSALRLVAKQGAARVILAVPVAPASVLKALEREADDIVCLATPKPFLAVGAHYMDFRQLSDEEVVATLAALAARQAEPEK